jgi:hypothetical protein
VPFDFLKRKKGPPAEPADPVAVSGPEGIPFDGLTEDWRLIGRMLVDGRLSDALNRREPIEIAGVMPLPPPNSTISRAASFSTKKPAGGVTISNNSVTGLVNNGTVSGANGIALTSSASNPVVSGNTMEGTSKGAATGPWNATRTGAKPAETK